MARTSHLRQTVPTHTRISTIKYRPRPSSSHANTIAPSSTRQFSLSSWLAHPRKESQDKDSLNPEAAEYTKSGTDDGAARQEEAAFDPSKTDPEEQKETAGEGTGDGGNPLDVSPANPAVSQQRDPTEGGSESSSSSSGDTGGRKRSSGGGSPAKGKSVS